MSVLRTTVAITLLLLLVGVVLYRIEHDDVTPPRKADLFQEVADEHQRWMSAHPEIAGQKEDSARFRQCNHDHAAQINGTPEEFRAAFDQCMREAYGLVDFQPKNK